MTKGFLDGLYGNLPDGHSAYLWTLQSKTTHWFTSAGIGRASAWAVSKSEEGSDVYCGISLAGSEDAQRGGDRKRVTQARSSDSDVLSAGIVALVADIDIGSAHASGKKYPPSQEAAQEILDQAPIRPTLTIHSGGGLHAWWVLNEPFLFESQNTRFEAIALLQGWGRVLKSIASSAGYEIDSVHDLSRVLRVPGTNNYKEKKPRPVAMISNDWTTLVNPEDFEAYKAGLSEVDITESVVVELSNVENFDMERHTKMMENSDGYAAAWNHTRTDMADQSASAYDLALCTYAAQSGASDDQLAALIAAHRKAYPRTDQSKAKRVDYVRRTIIKARSGISQASRLQTATEVVQDDTSERQAKIRAIATILGIPELDNIRIIKGPGTIYEFHFRGTVVEVPSDNMLDQSPFSKAILDLTLCPPRPLPIKKPKNSTSVITWLEMLKAIIAAADKVDGAGDATERGSTLGLLQQYCTEYDIEEYPSKDCPPCDLPFIREGMIWVHAASFANYCNHNHLRLARGVLKQRLLSWGGTQRTINVTGGKSGKTTRSMFGIPLDSVFDATTLRSLMKSVG